MENQQTIVTVLTAIERLGSITAAAKHLYVSQPYVSRLITQTEATLNVQLLDRTAKPLTLTYAGQVYLKGLRRIISQQANLSQTMSEISQSKSGNISISLSSHLNQPEIGQLFAQFIKDYPQYHLEVAEAASVAAEKMVRDNQCDLYIGPKSKRKSNFSYRIYREDGFSIIMPRSYSGLTSLAPAEQIRQLREHPYLAIDASMITGELVIDYQKRQRLNLTPVLTLSDPKLIIGLVQAEAGWSIVPYNCLSAAQRNVYSIPISINQLKNTFIMAHRDSKENTPEMDALLKVSQKVYGIDPLQQQKLHDQ